jgi:hypothetical protein
MVEKIANNIYNLSPDGSGRFITVGRILDLLYSKESQNVSILDVGGGSEYVSIVLSNLISNYKLTSLDIIPRPLNFKGEYIQADATNMSIDPNSYDAVITTDVLEHIPNDKKDDFISECIRVARDYVIIAAPFDTEGVDDVERATNDFNKILFNEDQAWLAEHFDNKKPNIEHTVDFIEKLGYRAEVIGGNNIYSWLFTTHINLMEAKLGVDSVEICRLNQLLNDQLLNSDDTSAPYYRHFIVIYKNKKLDKELKSNFSLENRDHSAMISYVHEILNLVSKRIISKDSEMNDCRQLYDSKVKSLGIKIDALEYNIAQKDAIIDRCKSYIRLKDFIEILLFKKRKK